MSKWNVYKGGASFRLQNPWWRKMYAARFPNKQSVRGASYWLDGPFGTSRDITAQEARMYAKGLASPTPLHIHQDDW